MTITNRAGLLILLSVFLIFSFIFVKQTLAQSNESNSGKYIVVLNDDVTEQESDQVIDDITNRKNVQAEEKYHKVIKGFSAKLSKGKIEELKKEPKVKFISEDREVSINFHLLATATPAPTQNIPNGIKRISAQNLTNKGTGVGVAVIDTGIDLNHSDLKGNIVANKNCVRTFRNGDDDNGHGTHVAGTIAAQNNNFGVVGVAPEAKLVAVKVLNAAGSGTWSSIICGIDWTVANASQYNIKVINMSLGGGGTSDNNCGNTNSDALHLALCRARDAGITVVVAAGNNGANTQTFVPAAYDDAVVTVSALQDTDGQPGGLGGSSDDIFASFSNYGSAVDIGAPGVSIYSTYDGNSYRTLSGTSMASPHVAGAAALYIKSNPGSNWLQVKNALISQGEVIATSSAHTDPSGKHPEPVLRANSL